MSAAREKRRAAFLMEPGLKEKLFDADQWARLNQHLHFGLPDVEVLITGWGAEKLSAVELDHMPSLKAIFHSGGTVKPILPREVWNRGVLVTTASAANALPVAEFTLASILFAGKAVPSIVREYARTPDIDLQDTRFASLGNYRKTIGIVGASQIGRRVIDLLQPFDFAVLVSDPYLDPAEAQSLGVTPVPLAELFRLSDIVSLHAPLLASTTGMISAELLESMRPGATLINTARGGLLDQDALVCLLAEGRITALLDVTEPEPLPADHPLRTLPNVTLTPHLAGARGNELHRLGESVVREVEAFATGHPPLKPFTLGDLEKSA